MKKMSVWRKFYRSYPSVFTCVTSLFALGPGNACRPIAYKCYVTFVALVNYALAGYSIHGRLTRVYPFLAKSVATLDCIKWIMLGLLNMCIFAMLGVGTRRHREKYRMLLDYVHAADTGAMKQVVFLNLSGLVLNLAVYCFDNYVWLWNIGMHTHKYYIHQSCQYFLVYLLACVIMNVTVGFTNRLEQLAEVVRQVEIASYKGRVLPPTCISEQKLLHVAVAYQDFLQALMAFSDLFGPCLLLLAINIMSEVIEALNLGILYSVQPGNKYLMKQFGFDLIVLCSMWALLLVQSIFFILRSFGGTRAAHERLKLAIFKLRIVLVSQDQHRQDLIAILHAAVLDNRVVFSAAGFFNCDNALLTGIIASVGSHIVTLLQINKES